MSISGTPSGAYRMGAMALVLVLSSTPAISACKPGYLDTFDIKNVNIYSDAQNSVPDPARQAQYATAVLPARKFLVAVQAAADGADAADVLACGARGLTRLRDTGPFLQPTDHIHKAYEFNRFVFSAGLTALKIEERCPACDLSPFWKWAQESVQTSIQMFVNRKIAQNNLFYWLGATAALVARDNADLLLFSRRQVAIAEASILPSGIVSTELDRGQMRETYSAFALGALTFSKMLLREELGSAKLKAAVQRSVNTFCGKEIVAGQKDIGIHSLSWVVAAHAYTPSFVDLSCAGDRLSSKINYFHYGGVVKSTGVILARRPARQR